MALLLNGLVVEGKEGLVSEVICPCHLIQHAAVYYSYIGGPSELDFITKRDRS